MDGRWKGPHGGVGKLELWPIRTSVAHWHLNSSDINTRACDFSEHKTSYKAGGQSNRSTGNADFHTFLSKGKSQDHVGLIVDAAASCDATEAAPR